MEQEKGILDGIGDTLSSIWNSDILLKVAIIFWVAIIGGCILGV